MEEREREEGVRGGEERVRKGVREDEEEEMKEDVRSGRLCLWHRITHPGQTLSPLYHQ